MSDLIPFKPDQPTVTIWNNDAPAWNAIQGMHQGQFAIDRSMIVEVAKLRQENAELKSALLNAPNIGRMVQLRLEVALDKIKDLEKDNAQYEAENAKFKNELLAESMRSDEVRELDAINHGTDECAKKLLDIAKHGRDGGVFGGKLVEECAQAILALRNAVKLNISRITCQDWRHVGNNSVNSDVKAVQEDQ